VLETTNPKGKKDVSVSSVKKEEPQSAKPAKTEESQSAKPKVGSVQFPRGLLFGTDGGIRRETWHFLD
jgi:hypothetical protein